MAQVYNHIIMPLANTRDRITQIRWGIADYQRHYGAPPEGMWLAETAADAESLELMAQNGVKFTLLSPHQCARVRPLINGEPTPDAGWADTPGSSVDTTHPYLVRFQSGASIAVFFYNGAASRAIAFEGLLDSGENFAARLKAGFRDNQQPQLVHVATDGESYGHHHKHGEMALAYALCLLERDRTVKLANYGKFLELFPPEFEAEIVKTARGAASMASSAGDQIAGATAASRSTSFGAHRCARHWMSSATELLRSPKRKGASFLRMYGPPAIPISTYCSIAARSRLIGSSRRTQPMSSQRASAYMHSN
jgi:hypothetical protein